MSWSAQGDAAHPQHPELVHPPSSPQPVQDATRCSVGCSQQGGPVGHIQPCLHPACTLHTAPCIPAPCTLHPWTLHPALCPLSLAPYTLHPEPLHPARLLGAVNQGEAASVGRAGFINQHLISAAPVPGTPRTSHCAQVAMLVGTAATSTRGIGMLEGFGSKRCFWGILLPALVCPLPPQPRALHAAPLHPQTPLPSAELQPQPEGSSAGGGRGCFSPIWDQFGMGRGPLISPVCHTQNF